MKKIIIGSVAALVLIGAWLLSTSPEKSETVNVLRDAHGLTVGRQDSSKVYIATHSGLLVMNNDSEIQRVSVARDDYMGFSPHPTDPNIFYTSGHPSSGGNLGFQKSVDGGKTWKKLSNGADGPVDFHAMAVSQADPNLVYGVYRGLLQRSRDEGETWEVVDAAVSDIIVIATNTKSKDIVYAGTTGGLYVSQNQGDAWSKLDAVDGVVTTIAISPTNDQEMIAYTEAQGLVKSTDGGKTWDKLGAYTGDPAMYVAFDPRTPAIVYLINQNLEIYKTVDSGASWDKVH